MNKRNLLSLGGAAAIALALIALPASSARLQKQDDPTVARLQQKIEKLQAELQAMQDNQKVRVENLADADAIEESARVLALEDQDLPKVAPVPGVEDQEWNVMFGDDG